MKPASTLETNVRHVMEHNLDQLGDALEAAARRSLRPRRYARKHFAVALVALGIAVPSAALATAHFASSGEVASSLPAGTLSLAGTEPVCEAVTDGVEYHCSLTRAPAPEVADWKGTVEPTVDVAKHVNGGCRSLNRAGTEWECYIGKAAVDQRIIGQSLLGAYHPAPGVG